MGGGQLDARVRAGHFGDHELSPLRRRAATRDRRGHRRGRLDDPIVRQRIARLWTDIQIIRVNGYRVVTGVVHPEHEASLAGVHTGTKVQWTEMHQRLTELGIDVLGPAGQILDGVVGAPPVVGVGMGPRDVVHSYPANPEQSTFLFARSGTIFGGTSEIQRNVIADGCRPPRANHAGEQQRMGPRRHGSRVPGGAAVARRSPVRVGDLRRAGGRGQRARDGSTWSSSSGGPRASGGDPTGRCSWCRCRSGACCAPPATAGRAVRRPLGARRRRYQRHARRRGERLHGELRVRLRRG